MGCHWPQQNKDRTGPLAESRAPRNLFFSARSLRGQSLPRSALRRLLQAAPRRRLLEATAAAGSRRDSQDRRGVWRWWPKVGRVGWGGKSPEKAGLVRLVPRWHGHQGRCRALVSTILYHFLILLQSPVSMKTWADAQYAKQFKAQQLELKPGSRRRAKGGSNLSLLLLPLRPLWRGGGRGDGGAV